MNLCQFLPCLAPTIEERMPQVIPDTREWQFGYIRAGEFVPERSPAADNLLSRKVRFGPLKRGVTVDLGKVVQAENMFTQEGLPVVLAIEKNELRGALPDSAYEAELLNALSNKYGRALYVNFRQEANSPTIETVALMKTGSEIERIEGKYNPETRTLEIYKEAA